MKTYPIAVLSGALMLTGEAAAQFRYMDFEDASISGTNQAWTLTEPDSGQTNYYNLRHSPTADGMLLPIVCDETASHSSGSRCNGVPARTGSQFLVLPTQASTQFNTRMEFYTAGSSWFSEGDDLWFGWSFRLSDDFRSDGEVVTLGSGDQQTWRRVVQLVAGDDGCGGFDHMVSFWYGTPQAGQNAIELGLGSGPSAPKCNQGGTRITSHPSGSGPLAGQTFRYLIDKERWYDVVAHVRLDSSASENGKAEVWVKPATTMSYTKFVDYDGAIGWSNASNSTFGSRFGYYGQSASFGMALYLDEFRQLEKNPSGNAFDRVRPAQTETIVRLRNVKRNKYLRMSSTADGAGITECSSDTLNLNVHTVNSDPSDAAQHWVLEEAGTIGGTATWRLANVATGGLLQASFDAFPDASGYESCGDDITQPIRGVSPSCTGDLTRWSLIDITGTDDKRIENFRSGRWLQTTLDTDVDDGGALGGLQTRVAPTCRTGDATRWEFVPVQ